MWKKKEMLKNAQDFNFMYNFIVYRNLCIYCMYEFIPKMRLKCYMFAKRWYGYHLIYKYINI